MDEALLDACQECCIRSIIQQSITLLIVAAVFCAVWQIEGGILWMLAVSSRG